MKITISLDREDINTFPLGKNLAVRPGNHLKQSAERADHMIITFTPEALAELFADAIFILGGPNSWLVDLPADQRQRLAGEAQAIVEAALLMDLVDDIVSAGSGGDE